MIDFFKAFVIILLAFSNIGCSESENMFKIENSSSQEKLIYELRNKNIPIRVGENGEVWFPVKHSNTVKEIALKVMESSAPTRISFTFMEPKYTDLFIEKLKEKSITFGTEFREGIKYVSLSNEDKQLWAPIKEEVGNLYLKKKVQEFNE